MTELGIGVVGGSGDGGASARRVRLSRERTAELRRELGEFIRSRRERTTPEMVGLPPGPRRRTPGLRREEVALLAGIGVTWYTWLEQGRPINVSAQVLLSVVRVLGLDDVERSHVFRLADLPDPERLLATTNVSPALQVIVDQLNPYPASVVGPRWQILAANQAYIGLVGDYRRLPPCARNTMWLFFTDPEWHRLNHDWLGTATKMVAKMRAAVAADPGDPGWAPMIARLRAASPEFRALWERQEVAGLESQVKCMTHHDVGELEVEVTFLQTGQQRGPRVAVYTPCDDVTRRRLEQLVTVEPREVFFDEAAWDAWEGTGAVEAEHLVASA